MLRSFFCSCSRIHTRYIHQGHILGSAYKSQHSLDVLYPNKLTNYGSEAGIKDIGDNFSGVIPVGDLDIRYSRSGGPGGQHVNKVNTKVEVRFHVNSAKWIPDWIKPQLLEKEKSRITKDGYLIITSDKSRKQILNKADCLDRIRTVIWNSAIKPYTPTDEELQLLHKRKEKARKEKLIQKREHSYKKQLRAKPTGFTL